MVLKFTDATQVRPGNIILVDGEACAVKSNDISKTGKHGASKCRIEAISIYSGKKKVIAVPGHERFDVPLVEKKQTQVLSVGENVASIMDLESYETIEVPFLEDVKEQLAPEKKVEYWIVEGRKCIMRVL